MQHDFILLDRSGSMASLWNEALGSINTYVQKLVDNKVDTGVTLATFDSSGSLNFDVIRDRITPPTWRQVSDVDATPRGLTPLFDAVGKIVSLAEAGNYDKVAIIIMTDGHNNDSKELNVTQAKDLLDRCRAKNWVVTFLGANFDNITQATTLGASSAQHVNSTTANMRGTMSAMGSKRAAYGVTGQSATMDWLPEEQEEAKK